MPSAGQALPFWQPWTANGQFYKAADPKVQREHHFALVDEADNIFIDEAKTPLIISAPTRQATEPEQVVYKWANQLATDMVRDRVCDTFLPRSRALVTMVDGREQHFCSVECRDRARRLLAT